MYTWFFAKFSISCIQETQCLSLGPSKSIRNIEYRILRLLLRTMHIKTGLLDESQMRVEKADFFL